jgi:IS30 family transposase
MESAVTSRKTKRGPGFILRDRIMIQQLIQQKKTYRQMAAVLGRSHYSIRNEVIRNGGRLYYNAEKANKRCEQCKLKRSAALIKRLTSASIQHTQTSVYENFKERIEILEQQIEILTSYIKESNELK